MKWTNKKLNLLEGFSMDYQQQPLMIGASGGSGTRVVARIVRHAGFFMGTNLNKAEDSLEFDDFFASWINPCLSEPETPLTTAQKERMVEEFRTCIGKHRATIPDRTMRWGWKNPRSILLLPFIHSQYPGMKFIHVVRDGRDMAYSSHQKQLKKHGKKVFLTKEQKRLSTPLKSIMVWSRVNLTAASYGETGMRRNYLRLRFEDLCTAPAETIKRIYDFLETPEMDLTAIVTAVSPPESIGRWRNQNPEEVSELLRLGRPALERFGYWNGEI
jgi:hypothetical protein